MNLIPVKTKILLVEDELVQRRMLQLKLEKKGYEVYQAEDGKQGLQVCLDNPGIRLVVTDLMMPVMDGFELIEAIRRHESRYTYIVALTALEDKASILRALSLGADDFISKPYSLDELNLRIAGGMRLLKLESQDELVFSLTKLAAYRSGETGSHLHRVREYCLLLCNDLVKSHPELGLTRSLAEEIAKVSPLHDIGKVAIPDSILHKPGKLTKEESDLMKTHATIGGNLLQEIYAEAGSPYLQLAYEVAMYHHEKWDGSGYPSGLAGDKIPLAARVMSFADVFDALISRRCYKESVSFEQTKFVLAKEKGLHFDPLIVEAFFRHEREWLEVVDRYSEDLLDLDESGIIAAGNI
ncbi:MAG: response regulator [Desulfobulbaceae bacterium]|nr:response regulator [Desulfobulbaceae bacterium]HIJ79948.1 response regulator [Deltaproteobacteria bacterium]